MLAGWSESSPPAERVTRSVRPLHLHFRLEPLELRLGSTAGLPEGVGVEPEAKPGKLLLTGIGHHEKSVQPPAGFTTTSWDNIKPAEHCVYIVRSRSYKYAMLQRSSFALPLALQGH